MERSIFVFFPIFEILFPRFCLFATQIGLARYTNTVSLPLSGLKTFIPWQLDTIIHGKGKLFPVCARLLIEIDVS